jgi:hypothetical protein
MSEEERLRGLSGIKHTTFWLLVISWLLVVTLLLINLNTAFSADDAAGKAKEVATEAERQVHINRTILKGNRDLATNAFAQNLCMNRVLAENDTLWRTALGEVLDAYIRGNIEGAIVALGDLDAAATVDIQKRLVTECPL